MILPPVARRPVGSDLVIGVAAEVPSVRKKGFDINDRGGRYSSEFIWNMGWEDQVNS